MFQTEEYVTTRYCSPLREMSLTALSLICQEAAIAEVEENYGYDHTKTIDRGFLWVIAKTHFEISRMPHYEERVKVITYPGKRLASFFLRQYRIESQNGEVLVKGVSVWAIVDANSRHMVTPEQAGLPIPTETMEGELGFPKGYPVPELGNTGILQGTFSNCDVNGHINNTKYFDFIEDAIPAEVWKSRRIQGVDIAYKKEIPMGQGVEVRYGKQDSDYFFASDHFDARICFQE